MSEKLSAEVLKREMEAVRAGLKANRSNKDIDMPYLMAASVMGFFDPGELLPYKGEAGAKGWSSFISYSKPVKRKDKGNWWKLRTNERRKGLQLLGNGEEMLKALDLNKREDDLAQGMFAAILRGDFKLTPATTAHEMSDFLEIEEWVHGITAIKPERQDVERALKMENLFAPMRRLVDNSFVGREKELIELEEYIGVNTSTSILQTASRYIRSFLPDLYANPPYLVFAPGGLGKSALMARLILKTKDEGEKAPPFIYLDIDRAELNVEQPVTLLVEALKQLEVQLPEFAKNFRILKDRMEYDMASSDSLEVAKSDTGLNAKAIDDFGDLVGLIGKPVILVIDTFEEAQFLGQGVVTRIWNMLVSLQKAAPSLRMIVAGRTEEKNFKLLELKELSREDATVLLARKLELDSSKKENASIITQIIDMIGCSPLSLHLAADIVTKQGLDSLKKVETRSYVFFKVREETLLGRLYGRILAHIHVPAIQKLAYPGLIVRRITPGVIMDVLAEPCKIDVPDEETAEKFFAELAKEVALVEIKENGHALYHRQDVRRTMLKELSSAVPPATINEVHRRAIAYYEKREGAPARSEEIYHRLMTGNTPGELDSRWMQECTTYLRNALEELPETARLWLSRKLGVQPDKTLLAAADLVQWEEITAIAAERALQAGDVAGALQMMAARSERSNASPLFRIELEALRATKQYEKARKLLADFLPGISGSGNASLLRDMFYQGACVAEATDDIPAALELIQQAEKTLENGAAHLDELRLTINHVRLVRKMGDQENKTRAVFIGKARDLLDQETINSLRESPAFFREITAELGKVIPVLVDNAIAWFGLDTKDDQVADQLSEALVEWNNNLVSGGNKNGELIARTHLPENTNSSWKKFIKDQPAQELTSQILYWRSELGADRKYYQSAADFGNALVNIYRTMVDNAIKNTSHKEKGHTKAPHRIFLSYSQKDQEVADELTKHLDVLVRQKKIVVTTGKDVAAGQQISGQLKTQLEQADTVICLLSPDYLANDVFANDEFRHAKERLGPENILPIITKHTNIDIAPINDPGSSDLKSLKIAITTGNNVALSDLPKSERLPYYVSFVQELKRRYDL